MTKRSVILREASLKSFQSNFKLAKNSMINLIFTTLTHLLPILFTHSHCEMALIKPGLIGACGEALKPHSLFLEELL